jgi:predicted HicB family RNase H-like nuclease
VTKRVDAHPKNGQGSESTNHPIEAHMIISAHQTQSLQILDLARRAVEAIDDEIQREQFQRELETVERREPSRVITVRMESRLHDSLRRNAYARQISLNRLCVAILDGACAAMDGAPAAEMNSEQASGASDL